VGLLRRFGSSGFFGHTKVKIMDGGRDKWVAEGRHLTRAVPHFAHGHYTAPEVRCDAEIRAFYEQALAQSRAGMTLIDVRSRRNSVAKSHTCRDPQEGVLHGGHIPGAASVPWKMAVKEDSTFKGVNELRQDLRGRGGLQPGQDVIAYCRIGERSSHTWFVLTYLLGYKNVRNYDGSWTEWGR
jgi:thiosulfate/3-mercaptopyruvate sulfurtransferase